MVALKGFVAARTEKGAMTRWSRPRARRVSASRRQFAVKPPIGSARRILWRGGTRRRSRVRDHWRIAGRPLLAQECTGVFVERRFQA